ncbi:MAG: hypothetical protein IKW89_07355 [Bacteroidales bacterium]|nr:hypothetical protein [Bacteroidales bacterium]
MRKTGFRLFLAILAAVILLPSNLFAQDDFQKGMQAFNNKDYKTALQYFLRYDNQSAWGNAALCYYNLGDYDNAIKMALKTDVNDPLMLAVITYCWDSIQSSSKFKLTPASWGSIAFFKDAPGVAGKAIDNLIAYKDSEGNFNKYKLRTAKNIALLGLGKDPDHPRLNFLLGELFWIGDGEGGAKDYDSAKYWMQRSVKIVEKMEKEGDESYSFQKSLAEGMLENQLKDATESRASVRIDNLASITAKIPTYKCNGSRIFMIKQDSVFKDDFIVLQTDADINHAQGKTIINNLILFDENGAWLANTIEAPLSRIYHTDYEYSHFLPFQQGIYTSNMFFDDGKRKIYMVLEVEVDGAVIGYSDVREAYMTLSNGKITSFVPIGGEKRGKI